MPGAGPLPLRETRIETTGGSPVADGLGRMRQQDAVAVAAKNVEHGDMGQGADAGQPLALLGQHALVLQVAQKVLQPDAVVARSANALAMSRLPARSGFSAM